MGISTNVYTFYGVKIRLKDGEYEKDIMDLTERLYESFEEELDEEFNFDFVVDGMDGEYLVIGRKLFDSGDFRYDDFNEEFCEIDVDSLKQDEDSLKESVKNFDVDLWKKIKDEKFKILTFLHFS